MLLIKFYLCCFSTIWCLFGVRPSPAVSLFLYQVLDTRSLANRLRVYNESQWANWLIRFNEIQKPDWEHRWSHVCLNRDARSLIVHSNPPSSSLILPCIDIPNAGPAQMLDPNTAMGLGMFSLIARFMGPTWRPSGADRTQVGPMLFPWNLLSGLPPLCLRYW